MRFIAQCLLVMFFLTASIAVAQEWEAGVAGGYGFTRNLTVTSPAGTGKAGLKDGVAIGGFLDENMGVRLGGEVRYMYRASNLKVEGGGQVAGMKAESHLIHYDILYHSSSRESRVRLFVAGGGGVRVYRGTGDEHAFQPAGGFALLTHTQQVKGLISVGGGVKIALGRRGLLRLEFRDYMTPFPQDVVAPPPGADIKGWLHDFVPMVGLGFRL
jgi:hypothetical protein